MTALSLSLRAAPEGGCVSVRSAGIVDARPDVARLLRGRRVAEALDLVARLYGVCGQAQRVASSVAVMVARDGGGEASGAARLQLQREAVQEHALRVLLDWPRALGLPADVPRLRRLAQMLLEPTATPEALADAVGPLLEDLLPGPDWLRAPAGPPPAVARLFDTLAPGESRAAVPRADAAAAVAAETGHDVPGGANTAVQGIVEEGAYTRFAGDPWVEAWRVAGRPVAARLAARFVALREIVAAWRSGAPGEAGDVRPAAPAPRAGRCAVNTARGRLTHEVVLDGERVADWRITVPTDVNFAPAGAWATRVVGTVADDAATLREHGARWARALDPCVEWRLEVCDA